MKERFPGLVAVALLGLLVAGTWWASDYALQSIEVDPPRRLTHERDSWSTDFVMLRTDINGIAINRLVGDAMEHFPDTDTYEITNPRAIGHEPDTPTTVGDAEFGLLDQHGDRITLLGNAHLKRLPDAANKLLDVRSSKLIIEPDANVVHTDKPVQVLNGNSTLRGTGMHYDNRSRQLTVHSASNVKISAEDSSKNQPSKGQP